MIRKLVALAAALCLLPFVASVAVAHYTAQFDTDFNNYCYGDTTKERGFDIVRSSSQVGSKIKGVKARITARALWPCVHGNGTYESKSFITANLQSTQSSDGATNLAQIGLGKVHFQDGLYQCSGQDQMVNDQTHFIYTPSPAGSPLGVVCRAYWVDFDNNGVPDDPIGGRTYEFQIFEHKVGSTKYWRFCVIDTVTSALDCINRPRTTNDGGVSGPQAAWWGCEAANTLSALGTPQPLADVTMSQMAYWKVSDNQWWYTENSVVHSPWGTNPSYYSYSQNQAGLGESWECHTIAH